MYFCVNTFKCANRGVSENKPDYVLFILSILRILHWNEVSDTLEYSYVFGNTIIISLIGKPYNQIMSSQAK